MLPTLDQCEKLWDKYSFPPEKRKHVWSVLAVAMVLSEHISVTRPDLQLPLVAAAVMLHDIDKNVPKLPGERHPDASVRVVVKEGYPELKRIVARHPLHMILDSENAPATLEEKILFLADKMAKYEPIGIDARFALWNAEIDIPDDGRKVLTDSYPLVAKLRDELCSLSGMSETELIAEAKNKEPYRSKRMDIV